MKTVLTLGNFSKPSLKSKNLFSFKRFAKSFLGKIYAASTGSVGRVDWPLVWQ